MRHLRLAQARLSSGVTDSEMGESPSRKATRRQESQEVLLALWIASYPQVSFPELRQES